MPSGWRVAGVLERLPVRLGQVVGVDVELAGAVTLHR